MCGTTRALCEHTPQTRASGVDSHRSLLSGQPDGPQQLRGIGNSLWPANLDYTVFDEATGVPPPRPPANCMPGTPSSKAPPTWSPSGGPSTTRTAPAW
ncbi:hypothetical protein AB5J52_03730 [Streptomyces sp. R39]|uniref:Uncharacterized protein n=1 Tax=Streptomyces sp. R39 TaxID=3238631 RepID=A0AB39QGA9_9ACTN